VPKAVYEEYKDKLPERWAMRAEHWYSEMDRVKKGVEAWRRGDIEEFGRLSTESGNSSIEKWKTGSPELKTLHEIIVNCEGVYGGRFSGAGFKGCCMALVNPDFEESIKEKVSAEYLRAFPNLEGKYSVYFCESSDGVQLN